MIVYKDVLGKLVQAGYTTYRIRKEKLIPENTMQKLRSGGAVTTDTLDTLCCLLKCQPGDLLQYVSDFAPPGEWCINCKKRGLVIKPGSLEECPWCFAYGTELTDFDKATGQYHKCNDCMDNTQ